MGLFFHWNECSICGEVPHFCSCTEEQKLKYESQAEAARRASGEAYAKRKAFIDSIVNPPQPVIQFEAATEESYEGLPKMKPYLGDEIGQMPYFNPMHNLELDLKNDAIVAKIPVKVLNRVTTPDDFESAFPNKSNQIFK